MPAKSANKNKGTAVTDSTFEGGNEPEQKPQHPHQDWTEIHKKTPVEVHHSSGYSYQAIVDEKSSDSSVVWVFRTDGHGRKMYCNWDGVELRNKAASNESPRTGTD